MRGEKALRERLERVDDQLEQADGHDVSHLIGERNALEWVLEER